MLQGPSVSRWLGVLCLLVSGCSGGDPFGPAGDGGGGYCNPDTSFPASGPPSEGTYVDAQGRPCPPWDGYAQLLYIAPPTCNGDGWTFSLEIGGSSQGVYIGIYDGTLGYPPLGPYEKHDLTLVAEHPNGWWQRWEITLPYNPDAAAQVDGVDTNFDCAAINGGATLTWGIEVHWPESQFNRADCLTWGPDVDLMMIYRGAWSTCDWTATTPW